MNNSAHFSYTDYEAFLSQLTAAGIITASQASEVVTPYIGAVAPAQAIAPSEPPGCTSGASAALLCALAGDHRYDALCT